MTERDARTECNWIIHQMQELKALFALEKSTIQLNIVRATSAIETTERALYHIKKFIESIDK